MGFNIMRTGIIAIALLGCLLLEVVQCGGGNMPNQWWTNTHAKSIHSMAELRTLIQGEAKKKHVFIDFYMQ